MIAAPITGKRVPLPVGNSRAPRPGHAAPSPVALEGPSSAGARTTRGIAASSAVTAAAAGRSPTVAARSAPVEAAARGSAVETATAITTAAVETAAATTTVTAAVLGESGCGRADEGKGSDTCQKSFQHGGFPHFNLRHLIVFSRPRGQPARPIPCLIGVRFYLRRCPNPKGVNPMPNRRCVARPASSGTQGCDLK